MSHDQATAMTADELKSSRTTAVAALVARYALVIVIAWFGAMKFTYYESHGISPLVANSPFMSWMYNIVSISTFGRFLGTFELLTAVLLALKPWFPKASILGGILASLFFLNTLSFMITPRASVRKLPAAFPVCLPTANSGQGHRVSRSIAMAARRRNRRGPQTAGDHHYTC